MGPAKFVDSLHNISGQMLMDPAKVVDIVAPKHPRITLLTKSMGQLLFGKAILSLVSL